MPLRLLCQCHFLCAWPGIRTCSNVVIRAQDIRTSGGIQTTEKKSSRHFVLPVFVFERTNSNQPIRSLDALVSATCCSSVTNGYPESPSLYMGVYRHLFLSTQLVCLVDAESAVSVAYVEGLEPLPNLYVITCGPIS